MGSYLISGMLPISADNLLAAGMEQDKLVEVLQYSLWRLEALQIGNATVFLRPLRALLMLWILNLKPFLAPLFIAIAGSSASISVMDSMALLGPDMTRARCAMP